MDTVFISVQEARLLITCDRTRARRDNPPHISLCSSDCEWDLFP